MNPSIPTTNGADPGDIPEFLLRRPPASPASPDLGCAMHPRPDPIEAGQQAWARLKTQSTWADWTTFGAAIGVLRTKAMQSANTNQPKGSRYNKEFGARLRARGFDDLEPTTRKRLLQCMENISAIEEWRSGLKPDKRLKLNHPAAVLSAWKRAMAPKMAKEPAADEWAAFFQQHTLAEFLAKMPGEWRDELLRRRDTLDKSKPDPKVAAAIKAALSHMEAAGDPKSGQTVAASNENAALSDLRGALRMLGGLGRTLHDVEIRLVAPKARRKRAA
jgi:hypothetical protein